MKLTDNQEQNKFKTFSCGGKARGVYDDNGYIVDAMGFTSVMVIIQNQDEKLIGKHIFELSEMLKKYSSHREIYISFLENVVIKFYQTKLREYTDEFDFSDEKEK